MTIVLPAETEALLREKAAREGHEMGAVANSILLDASRSGGAGAG